MIHRIRSRGLVEDGWLRLDQFHCAVCFRILKGKNVYYAWVHCGFDFFANLTLSFILRTVPNNSVESNVAALVNFKKDKCWYLDRHLKPQCYIVSCQFHKKWHSYTKICRYKIYNTKSGIWETKNDAFMKLPTGGYLNFFEIRLLFSSLALKLILF